MVSGNCWFFIWRFLGRPLIGPSSCVLTAFSTFVKPSNKLLVWATQLFLCGNFLSAYWDPCEPKTTWNSHSAPEKEDNNPAGDHRVLLAANGVCHASALSYLLMVKRVRLPGNPSKKTIDYRHNLAFDISFWIRNITLTVQSEGPRLWTKWAQYSETFVTQFGVIQEKTNVSEVGWIHVQIHTSGRTTCCSRHAVIFRCKSILDETLVPCCNFMIRKSEKGKVQLLMISSYIRNLNN